MMCWNELIDPMLENRTDARDAVSLDRRKKGSSVICVFHSSKDHGKITSSNQIKSDDGIRLQPMNTAVSTHDPKRTHVHRVKRSPSPLCESVRTEATVAGGSVGPPANPIKLNTIFIVNPVSIPIPGVYMVG